MRQVDIRDALGDVTQTHVLPSTIGPDMVLDYYGHALHHSCPCTPRVEYVNMTPVLIHRRDV
jgi:hypothetical protein